VASGAAWGAQRSGKSGDSRSGWVDASCIWGQRFTGLLSSGEEVNDLPRETSALLTSDKDIFITEINKQMPFLPEGDNFFCATSLRPFAWLRVYFYHMQQALTTSFEAVIHLGAILNISGIWFPFFWPLHVANVSTSVYTFSSLTFHF